MSVPTLTRRPAADGLDLTCPACGGTGQPRRLVVAPGARLVRCSSCRTQYLRRPADGGSAGEQDVARSVGPDGAPVGTDSQYWDPYKFVVYESAAVQQGYDERYDLAFGLTGRRTGAVTSVLDVGCGIGNFLDWARRRGITAAGVDVDAGAVRVARERGLTAGLTGEVDELLGSGTVQALTLWDVIEHVYDPADFLDRFLHHLAPGGVLLLETPDAAFPVRGVLRALHALSGGRARVVDTMYYWEHKVYFTEEGLRRLLAPRGLELLDVVRLPSPRAKMAETFSHVVDQGGSPGHRLVARVWPVAETVFRRLGRGNKMIVLARRRTPGTG
ncbi:class I SAM-dependent methyltransferase [Modestobacter sp. NPDC049651]|uniref:class I SAM-dependent methyltransferase n=1 Tax=unclassified Modestobacter TaxID=2643866 RepID=UPI0033E7F086